MRKVEVILSSRTPCSDFFTSHFAAVLVGREICVAGFEPALLVGCLRLLFGMRGCQNAGYHSLELYFTPFGLQPLHDRSEDEYLWHHRAVFLHMVSDCLAQEQPR